MLIKNDFYTSTKVFIVDLLLFISLEKKTMFEIAKYLLVFQLFIINKMYDNISKHIKLYFGLKF